MALGGLKPDAPKAPDPTKTAQAQSQFNTEAAQNTINMNALDRSGPFGSTQFTHDANGNVTGQTASLAPELQGAAGNVSSNLGLLSGMLPQGALNFDNATAGQIAQNNINAYTAGVQPLRDQRQNQLDTTLSERGIPIGSEIYNDAQGNLDRSNSIADVNAIAQAYNAIPGMQSQITANQIAQYNQPFASASNNLGLLSGLNNFAQFAPQPSASIGSPNFAGLVQDQYNAQQQQYQNQMSGLGSLASTGLGLLTAPLTGGASLSTSLLGMGANKLFGGSSPTYASNSMFNLNNI